MTTKRIKRVISFPERIQNVGTMLLFKVFRFLHRAGYGKQGGGGVRYTTYHYFYCKSACRNAMYNVLE
jgi:hypothetical protein